MHGCTRRDFMKTIAVGAAAFNSSFALGQAAASRKPNVVILFIDDWLWGSGLFRQQADPDATH